MPSTRRSPTGPARPSGEPRDPPAVATRRLDILRAAEGLFAARGFHGVSIRDIAAQAGVPLALVGYYFGPKVELYHSIHRARAGHFQAQLQTIAQVRRDSPPAFLLDEVVRAFVLPVLELAATPDGRSYLRVMARGLSDPLAQDETPKRELFDPLAAAFMDALAAAAPQASRGTIAGCYQFALGALLLHAIDTRAEHLPAGESRPGDGVGEVAAPALMHFIAAGIRAACAITAAGSRSP